MTNAIQFPPSSYVSWIRYQANSTKVICYFFIQLKFSKNLKQKYKNSEEKKHEIYLAFILINLYITPCHTHEGANHAYVISQSCKFAQTFGGQILFIKPISHTRHHHSLLLYSVVAAETSRVLIYESRRWASPHQ
jgi:hypothetical protein